MGQTTKFIKLIGTFERPDNTTEYATNDLISNDTKLPIQLIPENGLTITTGQSLELKQVKVATDNGASLFDVNFNLLDNTQSLEFDNVAQYQTFEKIGNLIYVGGVTLRPSSTIAFGFIDSINIPIKTEVNNIYCYLTLASETYTPLSKQDFKIEVLCALIDG